MRSVRDILNLWSSLWVDTLLSDRLTRCWLQVCMRPLQTRRTTIPVMYSSSTKHRCTLLTSVCVYVEFVSLTSPRLLLVSDTQRPMSQAWTKVSHEKLKIGEYFVSLWITFCHASASNAHIMEFRDDRFLRSHFHIAACAIFAACATCVAPPICKQIKATVSIQLFYQLKPLPLPTALSPQ